MFRDLIATLLATLVLTLSPLADAGLPKEQVVALIQNAQSGDAQAIAAVRQEAASGNAFAQTFLGMMYNLGKGVPQDYAEATRWFRKGAEQGNPYAQFGLATMYDAGRGGLAQDSGEAATWYTLSARQGNATAQYNLGNLYNQGKGVKQDYAEALRLYKLAAEQNVSHAQFNVAGAYLDGRGTKKDLVQGYAWLSITMESAGKGSEVHDQAARVMAEFADKVTPAQIQESAQIAIDWRKRHPGVDEDFVPLKTSGNALSKPR